MSNPFRFGRCSNSTFGAVVVDVFDLPKPSQDIALSDTIIGGASRSIDGTKRMDRFNTKREWPALALKPLQDVSKWAPVKRMFRAQGPWLFYDHTVENLLTGDQRLMQNNTWTNAAGAAVTTRADGAVSLAAAGVAQMGPTTSPSRSLLTPVVAGTQYFLAGTMRGAGSVAVSVGWYDAAGSAALSTTALGSFTTATALSSHWVLDGSVLGYRIGAVATAPVGALYAQLRFVVSTSAVDISDPNIIDEPGDPGNAMTVVLINEIPENHKSIGRASLVLNLSEV